MTTTKIYIAHGQKILRQAIERTVSGFNPLFQTAGTCSARELMLMVEKVIPDVLIIDLDSSDLNGFKVVARLTAAYPEIKIIAMSSCECQDQVVRIVRLGVWAVIPTDADLSELERALALSGSCGRYENEVMENALRLEASNHPQIIYSFKPSLSSRELSILELICRELTNKQIGYALSLSEHTVRNHKVRIMRKVGVKNNSGLVRYAMSAGYVSSTRL